MTDPTPILVAPLAALVAASLLLVLGASWPWVLAGFLVTGPLAALLAVASARFRRRTRPFHHGGGRPAARNG